MLVLLWKFKKPTNKHEETSHPDIMACKAIRELYNIKQGPETLIATHIYIFQTRLYVSEELSVCIGICNKLANDILQSNGVTNMTYVSSFACNIEEGIARDHFLASLFFQSYKPP